MDIEMLRSLNPEFRHDIVPGNSKPYAIRMPLTETGRFIDLQDSIFSYKATEMLTKRAVVEMDETPTYSRSRNSYRNRRNARTGRAARNSGRGGRGGGQSVTVKRGDTLSGIAKRNGTTVARLRQLNGIKDNNIVAGKKIRVR